MIATCGHKVTEGISISVDEGQMDSMGNECVSYGTYCGDCIMAHYKNGTLLNEELKKIFDSYEEKIK